MVQLRDVSSDVSAELEHRVFKRQEAVGTRTSGISASLSSLENLAALVRRQQVTAAAACPSIELECPVHLALICVPVLVFVCVLYASARSVSKVGRPSLSEAAASQALHARVDWQLLTGRRRRRREQVSVVFGRPLRCKSDRPWLRSLHNDRLVRAPNERKISKVHCCGESFLCCLAKGARERAAETREVGVPTCLLLVKPVHGKFLFFSFFCEHTKENRRQRETGKS